MYHVLCQDIRGLTLHLWNGEEPVVVSNFSESATAAIEEREGYQVVTFTAA